VEGRRGQEVVMDEVSNISWDRGICCAPAWSLAVRGGFVDSAPAIHFQEDEINGRGRWSCFRQVW
jgi:hypothetical protein